MGGALAFRRGRWVLAAVALAGAAIVREIYVIPPVIALVVAPRRRPWWVALTVVGSLALVHAGLAGGILSPDGKEAHFGASHGISLHYVLNALSPSDRPFGWLVGLLGTTLGLAGMRARWTSDPAARLLLLFAAAILPLSVFIGRNYWSLTYGPVLACYVPAAIASHRLRAATLRHPTSPERRQMSQGDTGSSPFSPESILPG
jgi:hypothetical protein